ncbi:MULTISPECIES: type II secretion system protein GspM [Pseudidiomarina]|uniref:Type II secretion system protein M n=2 Tax=Pseudidiomarina TaxID=2800384 RepID=A0A368UPI1_9GAMM|nr:MULTISPECIES: type II secretion system protein M [Pseudidiomarina]PWW10364.1 type II secretion system protein M (GspM) [Pseudidiomarina maritima]RBP87931.1 type II secretion system protein M (GspM) [Pseudidiomarina tainanensis]RCW29950.1 type II secretion system protein M (GspM) [Pseudidiomarina tainanensis]
MDFINKTLAPWQERYHQLNSRERLLVVVCGSLFLITLLYFLAYKPIVDGKRDRQLQIQAQQELLQWVRENTGRYLAAKGQASSATANTASNASIRGGLSERVTQLASRNQIEITRMQPQSNSLIVVIDSIEFNTLLRLIEQLQSQAGLTVEQVDAVAANEPGVVRVRRLQVSGA